MRRLSAIVSRGSRLGLDGTTGCSGRSVSTAAGGTHTAQAGCGRSLEHTQILGLTPQQPSNTLKAVAHPVITLGPHGAVFSPFSFAAGSTVHHTQLDGLFAWVSGNSGEDPMEMPRQDVPPTNQEDLPPGTPPSPDHSNPAVDRSDYSVPGTNPDVDGNDPKEYSPNGKNMPGQKQTPEQYKEQKAASASGGEQGEMKVTFRHRRATSLEATHTEMAAWARETCAPVEIHSELSPEVAAAEACPGDACGEDMQWVNTAPVETLLETQLASDDQPIGREGHDDHPPGYTPDPNVVPPAAGDADAADDGGKPQEGGSEAENNSGSTSNAVQEDVDISKGEGENEVDLDQRVAPADPGSQMDKHEAKPTETPVDIAPDQAGG